MNHKLKNTGFSLTEVLLAVGIFAVGMIFVAGVFPVAIYFTTIATERTIAAVAADEAFAKIRLYGVDVDTLPAIGCADFNDLDPNEFAYPSTSTNPAGKQYYWSALCRKVSASNVQVTVFVSRKIGAGAGYRGPVDPINQIVDWPVPVPVNVNFSPSGNPDELSINFTDPVEKTFINDGYTIVDNGTGRIYRVLERYSPPDDDSIILLDRVWDPDSSPPSEVWVVPPAVGGGRGPCIAVYQKVIIF